MCKYISLNVNMTTGANMLQHSSEKASGHAATNANSKKNEEYTNAKIN